MVPTFWNRCATRDDNLINDDNRHNALEGETHS